MQDRQSGENLIKNKSRLRVVHVLKSSIYSGAENVILTIIRNLSDEFDFVYVATDGPIREKLDEEGVTYVLTAHFDLPTVSGIVQKLQPDVVHAHDFTASVLCACIPGHFRLISHLHYDPPWVKTWNVKTILYRFCRRRFNRVLAVSGRSFESMVFAKSFAGRLSVVGNPVDAGEIIRLSREEIDVQGKHCDLIFVGRLVEQKDPQRFIRLVAGLRERGWTSVSAWMLGDGELREDCEHLIDTLRLGRQITMMGFQKNPYLYMSRAGILCITSGWEGFGLVAIEASILGIPVISTDNSGCTEIMGEGAPELCKSDEEFMERLLLLHECPEEYARWQERAWERAKVYQDTAGYMKKIADIYKYSS